MAWLTARYRVTPEKVALRINKSNYVRPQRVKEPPKKGRKLLKTIRETGYKPPLQGRMLLKALRNKSHNIASSTRQRCE